LLYRLSYASKALFFKPLRRFLFSLFFSLQPFLQPLQFKYGLTGRYPARPHNKLCSGEKAVSSHSTRKSQNGKSKPSKPYPEYPLTAHPAGYWCKKIRGKLHYFGKWDDPDGALAKYLEQKDDLHAGRKPRVEADGTTIKDAVNGFLNAKQQAVDNGELSPRTWFGYKEAADEIIAAFGKGRILADLRQQDFADLRKRMAARWGPHRLGTAIQCVRCCFKWAYESGLLDAPLRYGPDFKRPSKKVMRLHRAESGAKLFSREEILQLINTAAVPLKAMILLAINCGFGNNDCSRLPLSAVDLDGGVIDFPRPKTGISRRCFLWSETTNALRAALVKRPTPKSEEDAGLYFVTKYGGAWGKDIADSAITKETKKLLNRLRIGGKRNFYALRHTFRTIADGAKDQPAADHIMGHEVAHMSSVYRETISDDRLRAVCSHVRNWLFGEAVRQE
jgi:integrase